MSYSQLKSILDKIEINWHQHKVRIPYNLRSQFYKELKQSSNFHQIRKSQQISKDRIYEYFIRKNRDPWIPIGLIVDLLEIPGNIFSNEIDEYFAKLISSIKQKDEEIKKKYDLLMKLCDSDILWDEISNIEIIRNFFIMLPVL